MCHFFRFGGHWEVVTIIGVFGTFYLGHQSRIVLPKGHACGWSDFPHRYTVPMQNAHAFDCTAAMIGKKLGVQSQWIVLGRRLQTTQVP